MLHKRVEPRTKTPAPGAALTTGTGHLPDDLLTEQVKRLALMIVVGGGLWSIGLVMDAFIVPATFGAQVERLSVAVEVVAILVSALMFVYMKYSRHIPETKTDVGLGYMIFSAFGVAINNTHSLQALEENLGHLSWITIVILVGSMIITTTPRKMLAASLVAASMDPLGIWIAHLRGLPVPSLLATFVISIPNYVCALVAVLPSAVLRRLGRRLHEARAMGSYRLTELLGRGGMGEVWRAEHRLLASSAAIKLVRPEVLGASNEADVKLALRRFEREARATAALSSPHTIRLFDFGTTSEGAFYYVMELLSGRDLESLVREFGPLPAERAVYLLRQVCHSLADAHARGLVHRDIKPANIYVCRMGLDYDFVKVLDFGLVKIKGSAENQTLLTADHSTTGTPAYMAPEVILGNSDVDRRADVYALGCVAYFLLTGQLVFEADSPIKMLMHHVQTPPMPPSARTELPIPRELDELVLACLEKDPAKRPADASQLYGLACGCQTSLTWTNAAAKTWWEYNLSDLTGPLTVADLPSESTHKTVTIS
jgi:serine/threonine protein kinase/multidrug transporter EmrE-like cation transporter